VPPATVLTCEFDPLWDEGRAYARRLREAGVPVTVLHYDDVIHAFVMFDALERATEAFGDVARELEAAFSG
jgi:acetyl esterase